MANWSQIPREVRHMVFDQLVLMKGYYCMHVYTRYSLVCKEWWMFFEPVVYERLVLNQNDLFDFDRLAIARNKVRLGYVRHVWLRIELIQYNCKRCQAPEDPSERQENEEIFTVSVWNLLSTLSQWKNKKYPHRGLTLEISAHSESDRDHWFKTTYLLSKEYGHGWHRNYYERLCSGCTDRRNPYSSQLSNMRHPRPPPNVPPRNGRSRALRVFGDRPLQFDFGNFTIRNQNRVFPKVPIVTSLLIRRQYVRTFDPAALAKLFKESFVNLETIRNEYWSGISFEENASYALATRCLLEDGLPKSLKSLSLFKSFKTTESRQGRHGHFEFLSHSLCYRSAGLHHLSAAYVVDAMYFFEPFWPADLRVEIERHLGGPRTDFSHADERAPPAWPHLRTIALTTMYFDKDNTLENLSHLFTAAAAAVACMPNLETLELWNGSPGGAAVFRLSIGSCKVTATWFSTSYYTVNGADTESLNAARNMQSLIHSHWDDVARSRGASMLEVEVANTRQNEPYCWHEGGFVSNLKLKHLVADTITQDQFKVECLNGIVSWRHEF
ncbi:hypothetical protein ACHAQA_004198 [Verticillium albo-atrum]